jgi:hypothetical protein
MPAFAGMTTFGSPEDEEISTIPKREIKREAMTSVPSVQVFEYAQPVKTAHYVSLHR